MEKFTTVSGKAAPMLQANIDTDVIMPKQFLKGINRDGLGEGVFFDQRFLKNNKPNPEFILNQPEWSGSKFLIVGENFGCGSSREHAVWGLKQLGIRAVIGTTFAGIFNDNCLRNGVLTISLDTDQLQYLGSVISSAKTNNLYLDLPSQTIKLSDDSATNIHFEIDPLRKELLLAGLDAISNTLQKEGLIREFEQQHLRNNPWLIVE